MNEILTALWPVFALLCTGHVIRRSGFPGDGFWEPAERLIYFLLFPVLLIYKLSLADFDAVPVMDVVVVIALLLSVGTALLAAVQYIKPMPSASFTSVYQGGMRFNTYVGLAATATLLGDTGMAVAAVIIAFMVPVLNLLCVSVFSLCVRRNAGLLSALQAIFKNPLILSCIAGIVLNVTGLGLPLLVRPVADLLSGMALPLGLLAVGAGLDLAALRRAGRFVVYSSVVKLLLFPGLMLLFCRMFVSSADVADVLLLFSALPTAPTAYVLARQLGGDAPLMAVIITAQTLLSMVTMPLMLGLSL